MTEPRRAFRRVRWVYAHELVQGDVVCSDDGPWEVLFVAKDDARVVILSDNGKMFTAPFRTRFKVQVTGGGKP